MSRRRRARAFTGVVLVASLLAVAAVSATSSEGWLARSSNPFLKASDSQTTAGVIAPESPSASVSIAEPATLPPSAATVPVEATSSPTAQQRPEVVAVSAPPVMNYILLPGDTLSELADRYGTTVENLVATNAGIRAESVRAGDLIKVPDKAAERGEQRPRFVWPAEGPITTPFGEAGSSWIGGYHMGLDIGADTGDVVWAADDGVIVETGTNGRNRGYGTYILIYQFNGWSTLYAHLSSVFRPIGYTVRKGEPIGQVGMTGFADGPHLHFEVWRDDEKLDPIQFLP